MKKQLILSLPSKPQALTLIHKALASFFWMLMFSIGVNTAICQNRPNIEGPKGLMVNSYTGNLFYERTDIVIPGRVLNLDISFSYNSANRAVDLGFGYGWEFSYNQRYTVDSTGITFNFADSREERFEWKGEKLIAPPGVFETAIIYDNNKIKLLSKDGTEYLFENPDTKKITKIRDRNGNEITFDYSANLLTTISHVSGRKAVLHWENKLLDNISIEASSERRRFQYDYSSSGHLTKATNPLGHSTSYTYQANGCLSSLSDYKENTAEVFYNQNDAVSSFLCGETKSTISYDSQRRQTVLTQKNGSKDIITTYTFDQDGRLIASQGNCCGYKTTFGYDKDNNISKTTDANGNVTSFRYDNKGNLLSEIQPDGKAIIYTYEAAFNKVTSITDKKGNKTSFLYDAKGNLTETINPLNISSKFSYDNKGNRLSYVDGNGNKTTYVYDQYGSVISIAGARPTTFTYDAFGNTLSLIDANQNTTSFSYDALNRLLTITDALKGSTQYNYDPNGNVSSITNAKGNTTSFVYNAWDQPIKITDALQNGTTLSYDALGNLNIETDANGNSNKYDYDNFNRLTTVTNSLGAKTGYQYDGNGNVMSVVNPNGTTTGYSYNALNKVTSIKDALGNMVALSYDPAENITAVKDANGHITRFEYDKLNRLVSKTNPLGGIIRYDYDRTDNLLTVINALGDSTKYKYNALSKPTLIEDALGNITVITYDATGNLTGIKDANGHNTSFGYDKLNRIVEKSDAAGGKVKYEYDLVGNILSAINANGNKTRYTYDVLDKLVSTEDALGNVTALTYDAVGNLISLKDAGNHTTKYLYDALSKIKLEINPAGEETAYEYDANGNNTTIVYPNRNALSINYDALNRAIKISDKIGIITAYTYDANSNKLTQKDAAGNTTIYKYDALDRPVTITDPLGNPTSYAFDLENNIVGETDRNGNRRTYSYDKLNRQLNVKDALEHLTSYTYDGVGNLLSVTDARKNTTQYVYDASNRIREERFADNTAERYIYDGEGNLIQRKDNKEQITTYEYDKLSRLVKRIYPNSTETLAYDHAGRLVLAQNADAKLTFTYDDVGRQLTETLNGKTTSYSYNITDGLKKITYPSARVIERQLDSRNNLKAIKEGGNSVLAQFGYDALGRNVSIKYVNNVTADFSYSKNSHVASLAYSPRRFIDIEYQYDKEGNPTAAEFRHQPTKSEQYLHDKLGQLTSFKKGNAVKSSFDYDEIGNRIKAQVNDIIATYAVTNMNAYSSIMYGNQLNLKYDANGNLIADDKRTFIYDPEDRIVSVKTNKGLTANYTYDALGRRIKKAVDGEITNYYFDGLQVIEERDEADKTEATYVWGTWIDDIVSMNRKEVSYYYHTNVLGSVLAITDGSGATKEHYEYDPFGNVTIYNASFSKIDESAVGNGYAFSGRQLEPETGLYYYRSRYYDPAHGRFLQRDPLGYADGLSLYTYVNNSPLNTIDPLGMQGCPGQSAKKSIADYIPLTKEGDRAVEYYADLYLRGEKRGGVSGFFMRAGGVIGGSFAALWTRETAVSTAITLGTAGLGSAASAGRLGLASAPIANALGIWGSVQGGLSTGQAITGMDLHGNKLSFKERFIQAGLGAVSFLSLGYGYHAEFKEATNLFKVTRFSALLDELETVTAAKTVGSGAQYSVAFETKLPSNLYPGKGPYSHFKTANTALADAIASDATFANSMEQLGISVPRTNLGTITGGKIQNWVWHHSSTAGVMQLVPQAQHTTGSIFWNTLHPGGVGGMSIWGGGYR